MPFNIKSGLFFNIAFSIESFIIKASSTKLLLWTDSSLKSSETNEFNPAILSEIIPTINLSAISFEKRNSLRCPGCKILKLPEMKIVLILKII